MRILLDACEPSDTRPMTSSLKIIGVLLDAYETTYTQLSTVPSEVSQDEFTGWRYKEGAVESRIRSSWVNRKDDVVGAICPDCGQVAWRDSLGESNADARSIVVRGRALLVELDDFFGWHVAPYRYEVKSSGHGHRVSEQS